MTTVSPPPNWYADPTGRHEARYWDGFTWTAHVADAGTTAVDPLVAGPAAGRGGSTAVDGGSVGPGTASLRAMAAAGRSAAPATPPVDAAPPAPGRGRTGFAGFAAFALVVVLVALAGFAVWKTWLEPGGSTSGATETWQAQGYRLELPDGWVDTETPVAGALGGVFTITDSDLVVAMVLTDPSTLATVGDAEGFRSQLDASFDPDTLAAATGDSSPATVVSTEVTAQGDRLVGRVAFAVDPTLGATVQGVAYLTVGHTGTVVVAVYGDPAAVDRHDADARAVAHSVHFD